VPELPESQEDFEAALKRMLDNTILPPSEEARLPTHLQYMMKQFTEEGFSDGQALYIVMAIVTRNPGTAPNSF
jgi:hypothetical protein